MDPSGDIANEPAPDVSFPEALRACRLCPRACGARRLEGARGACGADGRLLVARAALHHWEEPPISGTRGSGAIFFSNCSLGCLFCQNAGISSGGVGTEIDVARLAEIMLELQGQGAHNINLVTPTHYIPQVLSAHGEASRRGLRLPVVYNTSSYENPACIRALAGTVGVWLPDFKYADAALGRRLSHVADYPERALAAIDEMVRACAAAGGREVDGEGIMRRGVIVRHLVLPGHVDDSLRALDMLWERFGDSVDLSVMSQYTPLHDPEWYGASPELGRTVTGQEYEAVLDWADILGFSNLWWQQGSAVGESFVPAFDSTGVLRGEGL